MNGKWIFFLLSLNFDINQELNYPRIIKKKSIKIKLKRVKMN